MYQTSGFWSLFEFYICHCSVFPSLVWKALADLGDTGLLDYMLKSMNNVMVGNHLVCSAVNPATRVLEYTVHDLADGVKVSEPGKEIVTQSFQSATLFPRVEELMYTMMCFIEFKRVPPGEVVVMPLHVTIGELKQAAESALGDTSESGAEHLTPKPPLRRVLL
ncbi:hypothetical protein EV1_003307 [Malus domestica]